MTVNLEKWAHFQKIVQKLIRSGNENVDRVSLKELKNMCKRKEVDIQEVFELMMNHLATTHCQVRISAFQIMHEFFMRSHDFRLSCLDKIKKIVELTLAVGPKQELPPPEKFHKKLKQVAIKAIDEWNKKYGPYYKKLNLSYKFLQTKKRIDFKNILALTEVEYQERKKREEQERNVRLFKVNKILTMFDNKEESFKDCITEANNCLELLVPEFTSENTRNLVPDKPFSFHSTPTSNKQISININKKVKILEDIHNTSVIQSLDDRILQITKSFIPKLNSWIKELMKNESTQKEVITVIKMKERMSILLRKFNDLEIVRTNKRRRIVEKEGNESDCEFEEVDENEVLKSMSEEKRMELQLSLARLDKLMETKDSKYNDDDKHIVNDTEVAGPSNAPQPSPRKPDSDMNDIIKSQAELDEEELELHKMAFIKFECYHSWAAKEKDTDDFNLESVRALNPTYHNVPGSFEPVEWTCRAPLPSGKLCPRMDRFKCPLHGKVIPRDKEGTPNKGLFKKEEMLSLVASDKDWKDVEGDVENITGEILNTKRKRTVRTNVNYVPKSNAVVSTPRSRLEDKIFDKKALRRANVRADDADDRRNSDRYSQQFNYRT